jgi:hypothetical protein
VPEVPLTETKEKFPSELVVVDDVNWDARSVTWALLMAAPLLSRTEPEIVSCCASEGSDKTKGSIKRKWAATEQISFGDLESREGKSSSYAKNEQALAGLSKYP